MCLSWVFHRFKWVSTLPALFLTSHCFAGGGPAGFIVVYNPNDANSVTVANYYEQVRHIPERNMIPYAFPTEEAEFTPITAWQFVQTLRTAIASRGISKQFQGIALAGRVPEFTWNEGAGQQDSLQSFLYKSPNYGETSYGAYNTAFNNAYAQPSNFTPLGPAATQALTPNMTFSGQSYWPVSYLAYTGLGGLSFTEALAYIDRTKSHDGTNAKGTIYWPYNYDVRSTTRQPEIADCTPIWNARNLPYFVTYDGIMQNCSDIIGEIVGTNGYNTQVVSLGNTYLPGAWVDNLTSTGGEIDVPPNNAPGATEPSLLPWIRAGVDGTSGTVAEPYAYAQKFPHGHIHTHLAEGASMVEAFWQSIQWPQEIVCFADPLLQPHAYFPVVTITSPTSGATVSGTQQILASATPTGTKVLAANLDLFIDGRLIGIGSSTETVSASRTGTGFQLDTTTLSDGWHELRVVAYNNDPVKTQGEQDISFKVNNNGQSVSISGPSSFNVTGSSNFTVTPQGLSNITSLIIQSNGRTIATLPTAGGTVSVSGNLAPLGGNWLLYAIAQLANGQQVWSAPLSIPVTTTALPAVATATPGTGVANIRFFANTTGSNFNWNTTTPDATGVYNGDPYSVVVSSGSYTYPNTFNILSNPSNLGTPPTGFTTTLPWPAPSTSDNFTLTTQPGLEASMWYYAPVTSWYEFANSSSPRFYTPSVTSVLFSIDGQSQPFWDNASAPIYLAAGWHALKIQVLALNTNFSWQIYARSIASIDFTPLGAQNIAANGTGGSAVIPSIATVTATPQAVTGTTTQLQASANIAGNTSGLTYTWSVISGPGSVTFSANNSAAASSTTATFSEAGNYVFLVQVAGPAGTAYGQSNTVVVQQTQTALNISVNAGNGTLQPGGYLDAFAYTVDQFGYQMPVTPTVAGQPTVQWSATNNATITPILTSSDNAAQFVFPDSSTSYNPTVTATGVNGRTGTASFNVIVPASNGTPTISGSPSVSINPATLQATLYAYYSSPNDPDDTYTNIQWTITSQPAGSNATIAPVNNASSSSVALTSSLAPGSYTIKVSVTDQTGAGATSSTTFTVNSAGTVITAPTFTGTTSTTPYTVYTTVGDTITLNPGVTTGNDPNTTYQWQVSTNNGATWQNLAGQTAPTLTLGPLNAAQNNNEYRLVVTNLAGSVTEPGGTILSVQGLAGNGGVLALDSTNSQVTHSPPNYSEITQVIPSQGNLDLVVHRLESTAGAVSVTYQIIPFTATLGTNYLGVGGGTQTTGTLNWADGDGSDKPITIPIVNTGSNSTTMFFVSLQTSSSTATIDPYNQAMEVQILPANTKQGTLSFTPTSYSVYKNGGGSVTLDVQRTVSSLGALTANYSTVNGTAIAGLDYTATSGSLTWANGDMSTKQITVPITQSTVNTGAKTFTINLSYTSSSPFSSIITATVNILDLPYEQWIRQWWASVFPAQQPVYPSSQQAVLSASPYVYFALNETSGTTAAGVNASGTTVLTGTYGASGSGSYTLGQPGPQSPLYPGFAATNTAVTFTASGTGVTYPINKIITGYANQTSFANGGYLNLGSFTGLSQYIKNGFTITAWVKTTTNNTVMALMGSQSLPTGLQIFLNLNESGQVAADNLLFVLQADSGDSLTDSIQLSGLPTGKLTDGNWHQIAIVVPASYTYGSSSGSAQFYFDGSALGPYNEFGQNSLTTTDTFANFGYNVNFYIGATSDWPPGTISSLFNGSIDAVSFFTTDLSASQIANIYQAAPPTADPSASAPSAVANTAAIPNLLAYALGLDPYTANLLNLPVGGVSNNYLSLNFSYVPGNTDITYHVQASSDLVNWADIWNSAANSIPAPNGAGLISIPDSVPVTNANQRFLRLHVTQP